MPLATLAETELIRIHRFSTANIVDDFNRAAFPNEIDLNLPAQQVLYILDRIAENPGCPTLLRITNGQVFVCLTLTGWSDRHALS